MIALTTFPDFTCVFHGCGDVLLSIANVQPLNISVALSGDSGCGQRALYGLGMTGIPIYNVSMSSFCLNLPARHGSLCVCVCGGGGGGGNNYYDMHSSVIGVQITYSQRSMQALL